MINYGYSVRITPGVKFILISTFILFVLQQLSINSYNLTLYGSLIPSFVIKGQIWRLITYAFLHGSVMHILFNMLAFWMFGCEIEERWGRDRFLIFYFIAVFGSGLFSLPMIFLGNPSIIGASGAVLALLTVYAWYFPDRQILLFFVFPIPVRIAVILFAVVAIFGMQSGTGNISHITHLGGIIVAILYLKFYNKSMAYFDHYKAIGAEKKMRKNAERVFAEKKFFENKIDPILKKISENGIESLSKEEKRVLESARKKRG